MTDLTGHPQDERGEFDLRLGQLIFELNLAIKHRTPALLMAVHSSEFICADARAALENFLVDQGQQVEPIQLSELCEGGLGYLLLKLEDSSRSVFFMDGFKQDVNDKESFYSILNNYRYVFSENRSRVVLWLTESELTELAHSAPEFWVNRQSLVVFPDSLQPERVLQQALESAWQGVGEYSDSFEDTDEKISLRESILVGLPNNIESTGARAHLLLTLGILNWRKGDFDKASGLVQDALKLASKMEDASWES